MMGTRGFEDPDVRTESFVSSTSVRRGYEDRDQHLVINEWGLGGTANPNIWYPPSLTSTPSLFSLCAFSILSASSFSSSPKLLMSLNLLCCLSHTASAACRSYLQLASATGPAVG